ncbi:3-deoxy-D-manno-octulosonic acid transferase [Aestuariibius sp. 2305UL40-4]|uniref:3-deoxy-D-manno-octulosonic acid transferase n=1 Tax=Aestuariibius violaceus TaxID=3234132 RepID=UPI00345E07F6
MLFYRLLISLAAPVLAVTFLWRVMRGQEDTAALKARLLGPPTAPGPTIWLHGASNGELASARPLAEALLRHYPGHRLWITANTVTGRDLATGWGLPRTTATAAPLDLRWLIARALRRQSVTLCLTLENELWPNRLATCARRAVPAALIAARMTARTARRWQRFPSLARTTLGTVRLLAPQSPDVTPRLKALGIPANAIAPPIDLKSLYRPDTASLSEPLVAAFNREATILFASTHDGEDAPLLDAFVQARATQPDLKAILAPRHPRRAEDITNLIRDRGLTVARRSQKESPSADIYLADTMGEMAFWYRLAAVTFVAGSLAPRGGHTPYEPAAYGTAILHGPSVHNFEGAYKALDQAGGAQLCEAPEEIATAILTHLTGSSMPAIARETLAAQADLDGLLDRIAALLPP